MRFAAVLFDMDGVLVDSEPLHEEAARQVLRAHEIPVPEGIFDRFRGRPDRTLFAARLQETGRTDLAVDALVAEKAEVYARRSDRIEPLPGVVGLLEMLTERGCPLACVTSATRADQEAVFAACGFAPYFRAVVTADDVTAPKPDPEPYEQGAAALDVSPADCLVVEDAPHGLRAGQSAGCTTAGLATTFDVATLQDAGPAFVAESVTELRAWLVEESF
jgi:HAD superfamily hydrolase (TIGR01509 family)